MIAMLDDQMNAVNSMSVVWVRERDPFCSSALNHVQFGLDLDRFRFCEKQKSRRACRRSSYYVLLALLSEEATVRERPQPWRRPRSLQTVPSSASLFPGCLLSVPTLAVRGRSGLELQKTAS